MGCAVGRRVNPVQHEPMVEMSAREVENDINKLPDGLLKNNLQIVLGSYYDDGGERLGQLLRAFLLMRLDQLRAPQNNKI